MSYTVKDLITIFRRETEDPTYHLDTNIPQGTSLWSNFELIQLLNEAQQEFAERTLVFKDTTNFELSVTAANPWIDYDEHILRIDYAQLVNAKEKLTIYTIEDFETKSYHDDYGIRRNSYWDSETGTPRCLIRDLEIGKLRVYPIPTEDDTVILTVRRLPLEDITQLDDEFEVPSRWQLGLLHYVRKEAYKKPIAQLIGYDKLIPVAEVNWEKFISHAESRIKIRTRGPGTVRYGGY